MSSQKIHPCLWFSSQAEDAAQLYTSLFKNSKINKTSRYSEAGGQVSGQKAGSVMTIEFEIGGQQMTGLNGGDYFKMSPAFSLFVWCDSEKEIQELWTKLSPGGQVRFGLDKYPWATQYGWTSDKYGVEWQFILNPENKNRQKMAPALMFVDKLFGQGEEAMNFYMSLFKDSKVQMIARDEKNKSIIHSVFSLGDQDFVLMEGPGTHNWTFTEAFSLSVNCNTQSEIDYFWEKLSAHKASEQCGWLKDKYGVSWQIVPSILGELMTDPKKAGKVMSALMQMKKLDIAQLQEAAKS